MYIASDYDSRCSKPSGIKVKQTLPPQTIEELQTLTKDVRQKWQEWTS